MFRSYGGPAHRNVTSPRDRKMTSHHYSPRRTPLPSPTADPAPKALLTRSHFPTLSRQFIATIGTFEATRFFFHVHHLQLQLNFTILHYCQHMWLGILCQWLRTLLPLHLPCTFLFTMNFYTFLLLLYHLILLCLVIFFFRRVRKIAKSNYWHRHVCPFSWNNSATSARISMEFYTGYYFPKICRENSSFIKSFREERVLYMKNNIHSWPYLAQFFSEL